MEFKVHIKHLGYRPICGRLYTRSCVKVQTKKNGALFIEVDEQKLCKNCRRRFRGEIINSIFYKW